MMPMYSMLWRPFFLWVKKLNITMVPTFKPVKKLNITMDSCVPQLLEARVPRGRSKSVRLHLDF
jgi:hypothetical protein